MKRLNQMLAGLVVAATLSAAALPVFAAGETAQFSATPDSAEITTGDTVTLSIRCSQADLSPAAATLTFDIGENYVFTEARTGEGISIGELSYSYQNGRLVLLYLDNAGGGSPLEAGGELAVVTLQAASAAEGAPMTCAKVDAAAVDADGNTLSLESSMDVGSVAVTGKTVALTTPAPVVVEEGVEQDAQSLLQGQQNPASSPSQTAQPASGTASQSAQTNETRNPAPTPFYTTSPSGEKVEILPSESAEPVDRTEEVLSGQPATAPSDSGATATVPWQPLAAGVVVVVLLGIFAYLKFGHPKTGRK